jgi:hypothetical protein
VTTALDRLCVVAMKFHMVRLRQRLVWVYCVNVIRSIGRFFASLPNCSSAAVTQLP